MKNINEFQNLFKESDFNRKVFLYFATKSMDGSYDDYEQNYTYTNLNPLCIKALVRDVSPASLTWKKYGTSKSGAVQIYTLSKYQTWFEKANKIEIDGDSFTVYKDGTGGKSTIQKLKGNVISVVLERL